MLPDESPRLGATSCGGASAELADDVMQDAFMATRLRWHVVRSYECPLGYVYRVADNRLEAATQERAMADPYPDPHEAAGGRAERAARPDLELRLVLDEAINELPPQVGRAARLHYLADHKVVDVASAMSVSPNTVKGYLLVARRRMRRDLGTDLDSLLEGERWNDRELPSPMVIGGHEIGSQTFDEVVGLPDAPAAAGPACPRQPVRGRSPVRDAFLGACGHRAVPTRLDRLVLDACPAHPARPGAAGRAAGGHRRVRAHHGHRCGAAEPASRPAGRAHARGHDGAHRR